MNEDRYDLVACNFGRKHLPLAQVLSLTGERPRAFLTNADSRERLIPICTTQRQYGAVSDVVGSFSPITHHKEGCTMHNQNDFPGRRQFLGRLAAGAATMGLASLADPLTLAAEPVSPLPDEKSFEEWLGRIKGKHKQVFDSMMPDNGMPLAWSRVFLMSNKQLGVPESECTAVLVLRHDSIPLAMEDRLWAKYKFGEMFHVHDWGTTTPSVRNAFWKPQPNTLPLPGMGLNELLDSGVLVGVCDMALTVYSQMAAEKMKMSAEECKKEWVSGVFPGVQIIPSGVIAVNRAQERGCTYCWAG